MLCVGLDPDMGKLPTHGDEVGGMGRKAAPMSILAVVWLAMTEYGYLVNPTIEN